MRPKPILPLCTHDEVKPKLNIVPISRSLMTLKKMDTNNVQGS